MARRPDLRREAALDALELSERRYRSLVEATATFVWVADRDGRLLSDIPRWRAITGQTREELLGDGWLQALHRDDQLPAAREWRRSVETVTPYEVDYRIAAADGGWHWLEVHGVPVLHGDGSVREFVGLCIDVTDRRELETALEQEREILRRVVEHTPVGIGLLWGRELRFRLHNDAYRDLVPSGRPLIGEPFPETLPEAGNAVPALQRVLRTGRAVRLPEDFAVPFGGRRAFEGHRYYDVRLQPVPDTRGDTAGVLIVAVETTEAVRRRAVLEAELEHERETAEALQRALVPQALPDVPGLAVAVRYRPAGAHLLAGGDWYDVIALAPRCVALTVGDVAGRGVRAATVMGQLRAAVRAHALEDGTSPARVLRRMARFATSYERGHMATLVYAHVDVDTRELTFARAGHMPVLVQPPDGEGELFWGAAATAPLGALEPTFGDERLGPFAPGSTVLLFTDGLVERRGEPIDDGLARLQRMVREASARPLEELCDLLVADAPREDDVALLAIRFL